MLAVDIGAEFVRVGKFARDRKGRWQLHSWQRLPLVGGHVAASSRPAHSPGWLRRLGRLGRTKHPAVTCISACDVIIRELCVPSGFSHGDVLAVLAAENPFPQALTELCVDYRRLPAANAAETRLMLAAAPRHLVDERCRQLAQWGLAAVAVNIDAFALETLVDRLPGSASAAGARLLVLLDHAQFALYVLQAGALVYTRRHPLSGTDIATVARDIARAVQLFVMSSVTGGAMQLILTGSHPELAQLAQVLATGSRLEASVLDPGSVVTRLPPKARFAENTSPDAVHETVLGLALAMGAVRQPARS